MCVCARSLQWTGVQSKVYFPPHAQCSRDRLQIRCSPNQDKLNVENERVDGWMAENKYSFCQSIISGNYISVKTNCLSLLKPSSNVVCTFSQGPSCLIFFQSYSQPTIYVSTLLSSQISIITFYSRTNYSNGFRRCRLWQHSAGCNSNNTESDAEVGTAFSLTGIGHSKCTYSMGRNHSPTP